MNTTSFTRRPTFLSFFACLGILTLLPGRAPGVDDPRSKAEMKQDLQQQIAKLERELAANPTQPFVRERLEGARQALKALGGGGAAAAQQPPRKKPAPVRPDPNNPWTLPSAMWTQKSDGSYEYYRLEKDKAGRNLTIVVVPTVTADGRVIWTDKKK